MLPQFPYMAMTVTGVMHGVAGIGIFILTCIGLDYDYEDVFSFHYRYSYLQLKKSVDIYLGFVLASSIWFMLVGSLGVLTGIRRDQHQTTNSLKIAYMITSILSAVLFSPSGIGFVGFANAIGFSTSIGIWCTLGCTADFILSIVSASICCCCANSTSITSGTVFAQAPQGINPPGTYFTGNYPPGTYPGSYPPGTYPPANYPVGNYPIGTYPIQSYPGQYPVAQNAQLQQLPGVTNPA